MHEYEVAIRQAERGTSKLRELRLWARERPIAILASALEELDTAIETLRMSGEELRVQEEALADAERALELERRRTRELFDFPVDPWLITDLDGLLIAANRAAHEVLGAAACTPDRSLLQLFAEADRRRVRSAMSRVRNFETAQEIEARVLHESGEERGVLVRMAPVLDGQPPHATGFRCSIRDLVTERAAEMLRRDAASERAARERVEARRQRLVALLDVIQDPFFALDPNWRFVHANRAAARMFSAASADDLLDRDIWQEIPDAIGSRFYRLLTAAVANGERTVFSDFYQPTRTWYDIHVHPGNGRTVVLLQPADTPFVEDALASTASAAFASDVAHLLNSYLKDAIADCERARSAAAETDQVASIVERALGSLSGAARVMTRVLAYTGPQTPHTTIEDINEVVQGCVATLEAIVGPGISLSISLHPVPIRTAVDRHEFGELLDELVHNAVEAMGDHGEVSLRTSRLLLPGTLDPTTRHAVLVEVGDNGRGMSRDVQRQATRPFFTTKHGSLHPGLGLSLATGIVGRVGGTLAIRSRPGHGTTIRVVLPAVDREVDDSGT